MAKKHSQKAQKNKEASYNTKVSQTWTEASLITVSRHRNNEGELPFSESIFQRSWKMPSDYERVWEQNELTEHYQRRINELLKEGKVVLKVIG